MTRTQFICAFVIVMRRSSGSLGRMEIKSSSDASQSMAFNARSRFPLKLMKEFSAHEELPTTTNRPSEFSLPVLYVPAAAMVSGPFLVCRVVRIDAWRIKFGRGQAAVRGIKQFVHGGLVAVLRRRANARVEIQWLFPSYHLRLVANRISSRAPLEDRVRRAGQSGSCRG